MCLINNCSFVSQEKGRYEDEEFIMDNRNLKWPLKGKCLRNEDGSTDRDDFGAADLVERLLVHFCIMNCSKMSTNRLEFIPEILVSNFVKEVLVITSY